MYCPKCSQHQISDEVRFCNRCGFQLRIVSELLKTNGELHQTIANNQEKTSLFQRRGARIGAKMIFFSLFLFIPAFLISVFNDHPFPLFLPLLTFMIGLFTILYSHIFGTVPAAKSQPNEPKFFDGLKAKWSLPFAESVPVTNELNRDENFQPYQPPRVAENPVPYQPSSVTENTTKFFKDDSI